MRRSLLAALVFPAVTFAPGTPSFCPPFDAARFCGAVQKACLDQTGSKDCWEFRSDAQKLRAADPAVRTHAFVKARTYFDETLASPDIVAQCCGSDKACIARLRQTRLQIFESADPSEAKSYYNDGAVWISQPRLFNALTDAGIEQVVLHELGHACQSCRHPDHIQDLAASCIGPDAPIERMTWADAEATGGAELSQCINGGLKKYRDTWGASFTFPTCSSAWAEEAFADTVFAARLTKPDHWAWMCFAPVDYSHGPTFTEIGCFFDQSQGNRSGGLFCASHKAVSLPQHKH